MPPEGFWVPASTSAPLPDLVKAEEPERAPEKVPLPVSEPPPRVRAFARFWPVSCSAPVPLRTMPPATEAPVSSTSVPFETVVAPV